MEAGGSRRCESDSGRRRISRAGSCGCGDSSLRGLGCGIRFGRLVAAGFFFLLRRFVAREVALLVLVRFEIGLVPAPAGQPERRRGDLPLDLILSALGAFVGIGIGQLLQAVELVPTSLATECVDRHGADLERGMIADCWAGREKIKRPCAGAAYNPAQSR